MPDHAESLADLSWHKATSDDAGNDEEVDLEKVGSPGGAVWAYVAHTYGGFAWHWAVLDDWLHDNGRTLASGEARSKTEAKVAVQRWVRLNDGTHA